MKGDCRGMSRIGNRNYDGERLKRNGKDTKQEEGWSEMKGND